MKDGHQQENPDIWLTNGNPWEIQRPEVTYRIGFYGKVDNFKWSPSEEVTNPPGCRAHGGLCPARPLHCPEEHRLGAPTGLSWQDSPSCSERHLTRCRGEQVIAKAYDNPIPGYGTATVGNLRLWEALPVTELNLALFNEGKFGEVRGLLLVAGPRSRSQPDSLGGAHPGRVHALHCRAHRGRRVWHPCRLPRLPPNAGCGGEAEG